MDFDALVNLKRIITSSEVTDTDIMLLKSAINNGNVDINVSISQNLNSVFKENINDAEFMTYLEEFINCSDYYLNTPIYMFFLSKRCFFPLLSVALNKKVMLETTYNDVIERLFQILSEPVNEEELLLEVFIKDVIMSKGKVSYDSITNKSIIMDFIVKNMDVLGNLGVTTMESVILKDILFKLLSYGYVHFSDFIIYADNDSLIKMFIYAIFDAGEYSYLLSLINDKMVNRETSVMLINAICEYSKDNEVDQQLSCIILEKLEAIKKSSKSLM